MNLRAARFSLLFGVAQLGSCGGGPDSPPQGLPTPGPAPSPPPATLNLALQFFGTGSSDIDRVKIPLAGGNAASLPVNIGATDFTVEFWIKGNLADNNTPLCGAGPGGKDEWTTGNIVLDRDVSGDGDLGEYGVSLRNGRVAFGVARGAAGATVCGGINVLDGQWHHVALTRQLQTGRMTIFVDGAQDTQLANVAASLDVSYRASRTTTLPNSDPFLVIGAEKRDTPGSASFKGLLDELRLSTFLRYPGTFTRPGGPFVVDGNTAALYHFDEGSGTPQITDAAGTSHGVPRVGGANNAPRYVADTPFP